jgi:Protein of unknown function DUF262.
MKNFDSRTYSINDFLEWDRNSQLELTPKFQRRSVWSDNARSFLMDTIIRGKPIPKVFIRQKLNPKTKKSLREVVDGQQRLKTILSFLKDGFQISKKHNQEFGGLYFSELNEDIQSNILNYEVSVDLLVNLPDEEVLDVFSRINSYAVTLNTPEKINANHFGPFKLISNELAHKYYNFWISNKILSEQNVLRMEDIYLVSDIIIAMVEGIQTKKKINHYYDIYEKDFLYDTVIIQEQFNTVMSIINKLFPEGLKNSNFNRIHLFYSLFTTIYHLKYTLQGIDIPSRGIEEVSIAKLSTILESVDIIFSVEDVRTLNTSEERFLQDSRRATTDKSVRIRRTQFLLELIEEKWN